jgi:hypothetical protein
MTRPMMASAPGEPDGHPDGTGHHGKRGEAVGAGVLAGGHQCSRADPATHPDPVVGHQLVAHKADESGHRDRADPVDRRGMDEPFDRDHRGVGRRGSPGCPAAREDERP